MPQALSIVTGGVLLFSNEQFVYEACQIRTI